MPIYRYGIIDSDHEIDEKFTRNSTRVYKAWASIDMEAFAVRVAFPEGIYTPHPTDPGQFVNKVSVKLLEKKRGTFDNPGGWGHGEPVYTWSVTLTYGPWNPLEHSADDNPLNQPIRWRLDPVTVEEVVERDINGNPICNTAGDPFDPPVADERAQYILTVMRNEILTGPDLFALQNLSGRSRTNLATWNYYPEKTVRTLPLRIPERSYYQGNSPGYPGPGFLYYPMEFQFHINLEGWKRKILNQGFGKLVTSSGVTTRRQITDSGGTPVSNAVLLDAAGQPLAQPIDSSNIVILEFEIFEAIDFSIFNFDGLFDA